MAEPLKNQYGADVPRAIAAMISKVHPSFNSPDFVRDVLDGYDALELMPRGKKIARALRGHLPDDYPWAMAILLDSLDQPHGRDPGLSLASFLYLPHTMFVAQYGLTHFELLMRAQHALTLAPGQVAPLAKRLSLAEMSTRKHYPGFHRVDVILNGEAQSLGAFELLKP